MTKNQEAHLRRIKKSFNKEVSIKYRNGEQEHGGDLWKKPMIIDMAMDEVIDLYVYLHTLREQLNEK